MLRKQILKQVQDDVVQDDGREIKHTKGLRRFCCPILVRETGTMAAGHRSSGILKARVIYLNPMNHYNSFFRATNEKEFPGSAFLIYLCEPVIVIRYSARERFDSYEDFNSHVEEVKWITELA